MDYAATRSRVEGYFDRSATKVWADLTSDAPVSRVRATVRAGRERMRDVILSRLPDDLSGMRVLDAGCGTGAKAAAMAARGAEVVAVDVAPKLLEIAAQRLDPALRGRVTFAARDMFDGGLGRFDAIVAQDSMIYYGAGDLKAKLDALRGRAPLIVTSLAPRTRLLTVMFLAGKAFPRSDRSPAMVPHDVDRMARDLDGSVIERVTSGFYISTAMELRA
ncbi:magnesium protoporphyrin IX methyltransferase [Jannaschia aquimarina]|uniref:Magnesium protoporphyrin IX methyltransferase n=1 Tax=Jannaschia aquimarina TaxID=935700 RepID=A0A0D1EGC2_9RHOB|nr:magnesium protoporphyrin IX methyltransferase [Jannaschia aquimarina]KIT14885.1 Magnesium-protoporphyrin O-methyltransferase [Jannaschia aquimarina]SNS58386.1 Mg-protoporphyrin IX methyltransferase [Jannaschia aquimarina]